VSITKEREIENNPKQTWKARLNPDIEEQKKDCQHAERDESKHNVHMWEVLGSLEQ
jgi:hypothetical protein